MATTTEEPTTTAAPKKVKFSLGWERLVDGRLAVCLTKEMEASLRAGALISTDKSQAPCVLAVEALCFSKGTPEGMPRVYKSPLNLYIPLAKAAGASEF